MTNLGTAYVSVMPSMQGFGRAVESGLSGIDTTRAGATMGSRAASGFAGGMARGGIVVGAASALATRAFDAVASSADRAIARVDTMQNFPKVMKNLGISADDASAAINKISDGLDGLPTALDSGVAAVQRFTSFNGDIQKSTDMFLAVNNAILAGGASAGMQASALEQLSQSYSKGKMDMMEWRTLQQAMPAQLKQVAQALGMTTEQLGDGLRNAEKADNFIRRVSMDEFVDAISRLNKEGINGLANFEQQARDATTGISTALANLNTRVAKGVATLIDAVGQENISGAINTLSAGIGGVAKDLAVDVKAATGFLKEHEGELKKVVSTLYEFAPTAIKAWGAFKVFQGGRALFSGIAGSIGNAVRGFGALGEKIFETGVRMEMAGTRGAGALVGLGDAMADASMLVASMSAGSIALVAGLGIGIVALEAYNQALMASAYAAAGLTEEQRNIINSAKTLADSYTEVATKRDEQEASIIAESDRLQGLKNEYNSIIDANGEVIAGYEARADEIRGEIANALGIEKDEVYGLIDAYGKLGDAANDAMEKRKAQRLLENGDEAYGNAVQNKDNLAAGVANTKDVLAQRTEAGAKANADWTQSYQDMLDAVSSTPEAIGMGAKGLELIAATADGATDAAVEASKAYNETTEAYTAAVTEIRNHDSLAAAIESDDVGRIQEWSVRYQEGIVQAEEGTRESLQNQVDTFRQKFDEIKTAVDNGDTSLQGSLARMQIALQASESELARYDAIKLNEKFASVTLEDGSIIDAQGRVLEWNGTELIDKESGVSVNDAELIDAQGNVLVWNGTNLESKKASVTISDNIQSVISAWESWVPSVKTGIMNSNIGSLLGVGRASGGFVSLHALGGFVTNGPTYLGRDARGIAHIAGEAGREWVMGHEDGTTSIVPIENKKYLEPYASTIASMLGGGSGVDMLVSELQSIHQDMLNLKLYIDSKVAGRVLAPEMNRQLGRLEAISAR